MQANGGLLHAATTRVACETGRGTEGFDGEENQMNERSTSYVQHRQRRGHALPHRKSYPAETNTKPTSRPASGLLARIRHRCVAAKPPPVPPSLGSESPDPPERYHMSRHTPPIAEHSARLQSSQSIANLAVSSVRTPVMGPASTYLGVILYLARGFTALPNAVLLSTSLSRDARLLYALLLHHAWQDRCCFPSHATLAAELGAGETMLRPLPPRVGARRADHAASPRPGSFQLVCAAHPGAARRRKGAICSPEPRRGGGLPENGADDRNVRARITPLER